MHSSLGVENLFDLFSIKAVQKTPCSQLLYFGIFVRNQKMGRSDSEIRKESV
jgi:hypothetical protein